MAFQIQGECPTTHKLVDLPSGFLTPALASKPQNTNFVLDECPHCGQEHEYSLSTLGRGLTWFPK